jgi:hypothetical protein
MSLNYDDIPLIEPEEPEEPGFALPPLAELKWLCVDLDGTLAEPLWTAQNPTNRIGDPIKLNVVKAREAHRKGWKIVIHTSRPWTDYESIEFWCKMNGVPARRIICGKPLAAVYVDDRARHAEDASWLP